MAIMKRVQFRARFEGGDRGLGRETIGILKKCVTEQISKNSRYSGVFLTFFVILCIIMQ